MTFLNPDIATGVPTIEVIRQPIFKKHGLSNKTEFQPLELIELTQLYTNLPELDDLLNQQANIGSVDNSARIAEIEAEIALIGTLSKTAPESMVERQAWVALKAQVDALNSEKASLLKQASSNIALTSEFEAKIATLKNEMGVA